MSRLLPFRSDETTPTPEQPPRVVDLDSDDADQVFGALSSDTARRIYTCLHEEPRTPSDIADEIDSSIQNVRYHLEKLEDAGLIDVVDVWYSSRGNEMNVYAPQSGPLIVSGDEQRSSRLRSALGRFVGGVGVLAAASLFVQYGLPRLLGRTGWGATGGAGGAGEPTTGGDDSGAVTQDATETAASTTAEGDVSIAAEGTSTPQPTATDGGEVTFNQQGGNATGVRYETADTTGTETVTTTADGADTAAQGADALLSTIEPGLLFFAGGLLVLTLVLGYWYWSGDRY
ncbi:ArsR/SmtB family transcription factor [Haloarchaeobius iranensis]|uniref:DNA-binding transcriptional regulator, ArsR family n=1 Tax=Haloarchaeobius iranensis TaxID=996166 RepID=A0A1G9X3L8_9EURY|nr:helix-turn-helix domain-containing protein [Haloarchaeobius iranensis]SDM90953.1 DNA-binding transcriptional regulator, ArsR family [Haloarchaeobius iranensis]